MESIFCVKNKKKRIYLWFVVDVNAKRDIPVKVLFSL